MRRILLLTALFILCPALWAAEPNPPIPMPAGDDDSMPPPVDLSTLTPLPVSPSLDANNPKNQLENKQDRIKPSEIPIPAKPKDTPAPALKKTAKLDPTSTPQKENPPAASSGPPTGAPLTAGASTDYFPVQEGGQWTYECLKPATGKAEKEKFSVKCVEAKKMDNGTIRATLESNQGAQVTRDRYSLYDNKVEHNGAGDEALTDDFAFKLPGAGGIATWTTAEKNGTLHKLKALFGKAQVYQKTYSNCLIVTEKILKGGKTVNTVIYYYAKGIGLVSMEVYSSAMKLQQDKSFALAQAGDASN